MLKLYLPKANFLRDNSQANKGCVDRGHGTIMMAYNKQSQVGQGRDLFCGTYFVLIMSVNGLNIVLSVARFRLYGRIMVEFFGPLVLRYPK